MPETAIDLRSSHRVEGDGSHTVIIQISGLPSLAWAQRVSDWVREIIQIHAHEIGRREEAPSEH